MPSATSDLPPGHWVVAAEPVYLQADCRGELSISCDDPVGVGLTHPGRWSRPADPASSTGASAPATTSGGAESAG